MNTYDRELSEKLKKLEGIEARLAEHQKMTRFSLIWLTAIGVVLLALAVYIIIRL